jgi:hypothetical protein
MRRRLFCIVRYSFNSLFHFMVHFARVWWSIWDEDLHFQPLLLLCGAGSSSLCWYFLSWTRHSFMKPESSLPYSQEPWPEWDAVLSFTCSSWGRARKTIGESVLWSRFEPDTARMQDRRVTWTNIFDDLALAGNLEIKASCDKGNGFQAFTAV